MKTKTQIFTIWQLFFSLILLSLWPASKLNAQTMDVGVFGGGVYYLGDINPNLHFVSSQAAFGAFFRYNYKDRWGFRLGASKGKLKADDKDFMEVNALRASAEANTHIADPNLIYYSISNRGLNFETDIFEIHLLSELHFFPFFVGSRRNKWTPYIFTGVAMYLYNPKPIGGNYNLRNIGTEGQGYADREKPYGNNGFAIPFGIGMKISLGSRFGLGFEWGLRKTFNDYLDDISTTYYLDLYGYNPEEGIYYTPNPENPQEIISFPITEDVYQSDPTFSHKSGEKRGNEYNKDWYAFFGLSLTFKINLLKDDGCRDFRRDSYY